MANTKTPHIVTPRIVQADRRPGLWLWGLALIAVGLWTWQVYDYGRTRADDGSSAPESDAQALRERIAELERERDELRFLAAKYERAGQIDREATQAIQTQIKSLQNERVELQREAATLRSLVSEGGDKLEITDYSLRKAGGDRRFHYLFTVSRDVEGAKKLEGWVTLRVAGESGGEAKELSLDQLSNGSVDIHKLGFKHYQKVEGELQLPPGFVARKLTIEVTPLGTQFKAFTISYDWAATDA